MCKSLDLWIWTCRLICFPDVFTCNLCTVEAVHYTTLCWWLAGGDVTSAGLQGDFSMTTTVHHYWIALLRLVWRPHKETHTCLSAQTVERGRFHGPSWNKRSLKDFPGHRGTLQTSGKHLGHTMVCFNKSWKTGFWVWVDYLDVLV